MAMKTNSELREFFPPQSIKLVPTDWARWFNAIAPIVTEARAFLLCGDIDTAKELLDSARQIIRDAGSHQWVMETTSDVSDPNYGPSTT